MPLASIAVTAAAAVLALAVALAMARALRGTPLRPARARRRAVVADPHSLTSVDEATGAVRSRQTADVLLPATALEEIWSPTHLERLARTYWRFLARVTLGLIHVSYSERERSIVLLAPPLRLLTFHAPEYEMDPGRGLVRWRIARGLLVARRGHGGGGYLQIEVRRRHSEDPNSARLHVSVEVANFYPSIASRFSRRFYNVTQSRIHVIVTNSFLRSLARLDLAHSRVGRFER